MTNRFERSEYLRAMRCRYRWRQRMLVVMIVSLVASGVVLAYLVGMLLTAVWMVIRP